MTNNRSTFIGSSDIAAIVGMSPFKTALDVYAEKTGKLEGFDGNDYTRIGIALEPVVAEIFGRQTGMTVKIWRERVYHPTHDFIACEPDYTCFDPSALVFPEGILECKTGSYKGIPYWTEETPPDHYVIQVQYQMMCTGYSWGYLAGLLGNAPDELRTHKIEADHAVMDYLINAAGEFWNNHIVKDTPPEQSITYRDKKTLNKLLKSSQGDPREPDNYERQLLESLESIANQIKEATDSVKGLEEEKATIEAKLKLRCQEAPIIFRSKRYYAKMIEVKEKVVQAHSYVRLMSSKVKEKTSEEEILQLLMVNSDE